MIWRSELSFYSVCSAIGLLVDFIGRGYSNDYSWLRRCVVKRCLVWSREQGLELPREREMGESVAVLRSGKIATFW